jgi:hypothetical protein
MDPADEIMRLLTPATVASMSVIISAMQEAQSNGCDCNVCVQIRESMAVISDQRDDKP